MKKVVVMDLLCMVPYYCTYLVKALTAQGLEVKLASISFHHDLTLFKNNNIKNAPGLLDVVSILGIKTSSIRRFFKVIEYCLNLFAYSFRFLFYRVDVLHIQWLPLLTKFKIELLFLYWVKLLKVKVVLTVHNLLPHDTGNRYYNLYKKVYRLPHLLICHTGEMKTALENDFGVDPAKICVIPHGVMFNDSNIISRGIARKELSLSDDQVAALCFGIIRPYKGIEFLLEAWQKVKHETPTAKLIIAGGGDNSYLDTIRKKVKDLKLGKSVDCYFEFIPTEKLPLFHIASDILVYPYKEVTQSGALLTGLAFGKAIVATNVGGFKELLLDQETALLVEYGDVNKLSSALNQLICDHGLRNELGASITNMVGTELSWNSVAEKTINCYRSLYLK